jgi:tRNA-specific 2-thiouridylase
MKERMRVLLGMSGGIDSSVAAILLQEKGYEVIGMTLRVWSENDNINNKSIPAYIVEAQDLAKRLNIEHYVVDVREEFYNSVISYFKKEYLKGRTPNPCAKCNIIIKWHFLNEYAIKTNCDYIATGHYVNKITIDKFHYITKGVDEDKDQSFFLWGLSQEILEKAIFPLGNYTKQDVKDIANGRDLNKISLKKESTGICFINTNKYQPFISKLLQDEGILMSKGNFIDNNKNILGKHNGYVFYTVGQRRGLGFEPEKPYYVTKINSKDNTIEIGHKDDLFCNEIIVENYNLINIEDFEEPVITKIRYRKQEVLSRVDIVDKNLLRVKFIIPEWSISPGQTAVFYNKNILLGGGFIKECNKK